MPAEVPDNVTGPRRESDLRVSLVLMHPLREDRFRKLVFSAYIVGKFAVEKPDRDMQIFLTPPAARSFLYRK